MGMFDNVKLLYPVAVPGVDDPSALDWQSKDTPSQFLDEYEIRADGSLWRKQYKTSEWVEDASHHFGSYLKREDPYWEEVPYGGQLEIYTTTGGKPDRWVEIRFWFKGDRVRDVFAETRELPPPPTEEERKAE